MDATMRRRDAMSGSRLEPPSTLQDKTGAVSAVNVAAVAWSPSGTEIVTGSSDGTLRLWNAVTGSPMGEPIDAGSYVHSVEWSPDGTRLAAGGITGVRVWESVPERVACQWALHALGAEGLRAIAGGAPQPLRCARPDSVTDLAPLPVIPLGAP
jgi:WD40 repeat protein